MQRELLVKRITASTQNRRLLGSGEPFLAYELRTVHPGCTRVWCAPAILLFPEGLECGILAFVHEDILQKAGNAQHVIDLRRRVT